MKIAHGPKALRVYESFEGKKPYLEWLRGLRDSVTVARIRVRIDRLEEGNFGNYKSLGRGLYEIKLDFGPGFRIYFSVIENEVVLLLSGGDKSSQARDIETARQYLADYLERKV